MSLEANAAATSIKLADAMRRDLVILNNLVTAVINARRHKESFLPDPWGERRCRLPSQLGADHDPCKVVLSAGGHHPPCSKARRAWRVAPCNSFSSLSSSGPTPLLCSRCFAVSSATLFGNRFHQLSASYHEIAPEQSSARAGHSSVEGQCNKQYVPLHFSPTLFIVTHITPSSRR